MSNLIQINIEILSHVLQAKTIFHTWNSNFYLRTFVINANSKLEIEILKDFKKNYYFVCPDLNIGVRIEIKIEEYRK